MVENNDAKDAGVSHHGSNSWQSVSFLSQLIPGWALHLLGGSVKVNQYHTSEGNPFEIWHWWLRHILPIKPNRCFILRACENGRVWMDTCRSLESRLESRMMPTCCLYSPPLDSSTKKDWKNERSVCWYGHQATATALLISCSWFNALWKNNTAPDNIDPNYMTINLQKPDL